MLLFRNSHFAGATRRIRPDELSVASHSAPSGPWRKSRLRSFRSRNRRSSLTTFWHGAAALALAAVVERHPGRRDRRHPVPERLLHAFLLRALVDLGAAVVDAVADHRPAVVLAFVDEVDL